VAAQDWDSSGNGLLNGSYLFRQVAYQTNELGSVPVALTLFGFIRFDGAGTYAISGTIFDSRLGHLVAYQLNGTYSIAASGYGFISQPLANSNPVYGLVANGIFIGSTVDGFSDLMIAVPAGAGSAQAFTGNYTIAYAKFKGSFSTAYDAIAELNPDGVNSLGDVVVTSYHGIDPNPTQVLYRSVTYTFNGGLGSINFPVSPIIGGSHLIFMSPDGNFIFGGSTMDFDFYVGVRKAAPNTNPPSLNGLYYGGGIDQDNSALTSGSLNTYIGAFKTALGVILSNQRIRHSSVSLNTPAQSFGSRDSYPLAPATQYVGQSGFRDFIISKDGNYRIGFGRPPFLGVEIGIRAPTLGGSGVFLDPTGVVNGGSYSSFTSGIARGELLVLNGNGLAGSLTVAPGIPFPFILGNVQVFINDRPCALYYVSQSQIAAIVPYGTVEPIARIQVVNNGVASNVVTSFVYNSAPGVFSLTSNGIGLAGARHLNNSIVTEDNPAHPGEFVQVFLTGLGNVSPAIADGAPGGTTTLNQTVNQITATVGGLAAEVQYSGLAPTLSGLYQLNVKIPAAAVAGDLLLSVAGPDAVSAQLSIPVAVP